MATRFEMSLIAELASLNMAVMKALSGVASFGKSQGVDPRTYFSSVLEAGIRDLPKTNYPDIGPEQLEEFHEMAIARYTDLITAIRSAEK